jgi:hypothetical protein
MRVVPNAQNDLGYWQRHPLDLIGVSIYVLRVFPCVGRVSFFLFDEACCGQSVERRGVLLTMYTRTHRRVDMRFVIVPWLVFSLCFSFRPRRSGLLRILAVILCTLFVLLRYRDRFAHRPFLNFFPFPEIRVRSPREGTRECRRAKGRAIPWRERQ